MNAYDELIMYFTDKKANSDDWTYHAHIQGEFVYASTATVCARVDVKKFSPEFSPTIGHPKAPVFAKIYDVEQHDPVIIKVDKLAEILRKVPKTEDWMYCDKCNGEGDIRCPCCGYAHECDECGGEGTVVDATVPEVYIDNDYFIRVGKAYFSAPKLYVLQKVCERLNEPDIRLVKYGSAMQTCWFVVGDVNILIAPISPYTTEDFGNKRKFKLL